jgi:hypothetical protein
MHRNLNYKCPKLCNYTGSGCLENVIELTLWSYGVKRLFCGRGQIICFWIVVIYKSLLVLGNVHWEDWSINGKIKFGSLGDCLWWDVNNFGSYTVHYRIYKDRPTNALSCMFLYFSQWLLHVSTRQCHPQGASGFLLSYFKVQCVRRQVTESMV